MINTNKGSELGPKMDQAPAAMTPSTQEETTGTSPWRHESRTWKDGEAGGTPITAAALNQIDTELASLFASTPVYTVASVTDKVPSSPSLVHVVDRAGVYRGTWVDMPSGRQPVYNPELLTLTVGPLTFRRLGRFVSVEMFWNELGVDVHETDGIVSLGFLPEGWRPISAVTGLLLSDGPLMPIANIAIGGDGNVTARVSGQDLSRNMKLSLTTVTYIAA